MNWRQFLATLIQTITWPVTVLAVALMFRKKINELLGGRLKKLKLGPVEGEWEADLRAAREAVLQDAPREAVSTEPEPEPEPEPEREPEPESEPNQTGLGDGSEQSGQQPGEARSTAEQLLEVRSIVGSSPTAAVLMGYRIFEQALDRLLSMLGKPALYEARGRTVPVHRRVELLAQTGVILPGTAYAIDKLRRIRNEVAHAPRDVNGAEARLYLDTLDDVVRTLTHPATIYESRVISAINDLGTNVVRASNLRAIDALAVTGKGALAVIIKYQRSLLGGSDFYNQSVLAGRSLKDSPNGILVVTNAELTNSARQFNSRGSLLGRPVEAITWNSQEDNDLLMRAMLRVSVS